MLTASSSEAQTVAIWLAFHRSRMPHAYLDNALLRHLVFSTINSKHILYAQQLRDAQVRVLPHQSGCSGQWVTSNSISMLWEDLCMKVVTKGHPFTMFPDILIIQLGFCHWIEVSLKVAMLTNAECWRQASILTQSTWSCFSWLR